MTRYDALRRKFRALISELVEPLVDELLEKVEREVRSRFEAALSGGRPPDRERTATPVRRKPSERAMAKPPASKPRAAIAPQIEKQTAPARNPSPAREAGASRPCGCGGLRGPHRKGCGGEASAPEAVISPAAQREKPTAAQQSILDRARAAKRRAEILARAKARQGSN